MPGCPAHLASAVCGKHPISPVAGSAYGRVTNNDNFHPFTSGSARKPVQPAIVRGIGQGRGLPNRKPANGKTVKTFEAQTDAQLEVVVNAAAICFGQWRKKSFTERAAIVAKAAALLRTQADKFAGLVTLEMGKLIAEARGEVTLSADILDYYAKNAERFPAPRKN